MSYKRLPDAELEVMQALWSCEKASSRADIGDILKENHPMAPTTLLTLLGRLSEKGFVKVCKEGKMTVYAPDVKREDYIASQSRSFFSRVCGGSVSAFASALCSGGLTEEELAQLRQLLNGEKK